MGAPLRLGLLSGVLYPEWVLGPASGGEAPATPGTRAAAGRRQPTCNWQGFCPSGSSLRLPLL